MTLDHIKHRTPYVMEEAETPGDPDQSPGPRKAVSEAEVRKSTVHYLLCKLMNSMAASGLDYVATSATLERGK